MGRARSVGNNTITLHQIETENKLQVKILAKETGETLHTACPHTPEARSRLTSASQIGQAQDDTRQRRTSTQRLTSTQGLTHHAVQSHPRWYGEQGKRVDKIE